ncbi:glycoside hydrolase family 140 protein [candidate division KSB1 bacterium]|nr:glycoside hydrolase family 140 protein [candidate division KSB1 bacterium]
MQKIIFCILTALFIGLLGGCSGDKTKMLRVSDNHRYLVYSDGTPFFYLGDTAWELFHRLNREEADLYLSDRAGKGFTVIQAVVLAEFDGLTAPNAYGFVPLQNNDPTQPVEEYFQHVDYIVNKANELGMFIGMLPTWGDKFNKKWGIGPEIFTPENAEIYGEFLGKRYRDRQIIWILGGDRSPENDTHLAIFDALAKGLEKGDGGVHLKTYHPMGGGNSSTWFHNKDWLSFNMFQSGHHMYDNPNYKPTRYNYALTPVKPTLDGEPRYEDHPVNWNPENGWFDDFDVRQAAYWSMLSGAAGFTYGDHNIWQMWQPDRQPISSARTPWREAVHHIGSAQMGYMRRLFESRPWYKLVPDTTLILGENIKDAGYITSAIAGDGGFIVAYTPLGRPVELDLTKISGDSLIVYWFDPRTGKAEISGPVIGKASRTFTPVSNGRGNDWVLIVEDKAAKLITPGD